MKLARLFLAVLAIGALAACGSTPTAPEAQPADPPRNEGECIGRWEIDPVTGVAFCNGHLGSGG
jgi:hypothetical protein